MREILNKIKKFFCNTVFVKAGFITFVYFIIITFFAKIDYIRENYADLSFNIMNVLLYHKEEKTASPKNLIILFNDEFVKSRGLLNKYNEPTYGAVFPRQIIAEYINMFDRVYKLNKIHPKALFIDYDFSYTSMPDGKTLSPGDRELIKALAKNRPYTIYIPQRASYNFIKNSKNKTIQKLIKNKKIVFVSVDLLENNDGNIKRYVPYSEIGGKKYTNIAVLLYEKETGHKLNFKDLTLYTTDILFKGYKNKNHSYWDNIYKFSADRLQNEEFLKNYNGSIIFLGSSYHYNNDKYQVLPLLPIQFNGIEVLANTLQTLYYFDGPLKTKTFLNFIIVYLITLLLVYIFHRYNKELLDVSDDDLVKSLNDDRKKVKNIKTIIKTINMFDFWIWAIVSGVVSLVVLLYLKIWIDYLVLGLSFLTVKFLCELEIYVNSFKNIYLFFKKIFVKEKK